MSEMRWFNGAGLIKLGGFYASQASGWSLTRKINTGA
jgi:hypothetical protein